MSECAGQPKDGKREFLKLCYKFLLDAARKFGRGQFVVNSAMVFILKYIRVHPHNDAHRFLLCVGSFLLAAKTRDEPLYLDYVASFLRSVTNPMVKTKISHWELENLKSSICEMEYSILIELGFDCDLDLPNNYIAEFCNDVHSINKDLEKYAYMFLNDSFQTECFLYFHPKIIAAACVWMSHIFLSKMNISA